MLYVWKEKTQNFLQATCDLHLATNISNYVRQPEHYTSFFICSFIFIASGILLHGRFMIRLHQSQIKVKSIGKIWISKVSYCSVCTTLEKGVLLLLCCSESVACSQWAADTKEKSVIHELVAAINLLTVLIEANTSGDSQLGKPQAVNRRRWAAKMTSFLQEIRWKSDH
jgi:hypothetical protein